MAEAEEFAAFDWNQARLDHRGYLPHIRQDQVIYFVTFRLADSLPADRVAELKEQRNAWLRLNPPPHSPPQEREYRLVWHAGLERILDAGHGRCILRDPRCRRILEEHLRFADGTRYHLGQFVIMPNHVHVLLQMSQSYELATTIQSWKSISARQIDKLLSTGPLWRREYFDHAVRSDEGLDRIVRYIVHNPKSLPAEMFALGHGSLAMASDRNR